MNLGPRRTRVERSGDDTFQCYQQPTAKTLFNGELFKEQERVFLKKTLRLHNVSFPIGHDRTVQIELKSFWQPEALKLDGKGARCGRFVTLLSDHRPPIKDSFAWIKLVRPLYKRGFSVVLLDLPGAGGSGCNANIGAAYEDWEHEDFRIVENAMRGLNVTRTHLIAFGRSCRIILKFAKLTHIDGYTTFLAKEHCWYQPDIDFFALFRDEVGDCPPGKVQEWRIEAQKQHEHLLLEVLKPVRIMAFHEVHPDEAVKATQQFIARARRAEAAALSEFYCTEVSREDICFARAHAALDVSIMAMSKNLMNTMVDFLLTANHPDVVIRPFAPHHAVKDGLFKACVKGCVNPARGLHHWSCPNHPKNAAHGVGHQKEDAPPEEEAPKEELLMLPGPAATRQRPASAPAGRHAGRVEDRAGLQNALRLRGPERTWVVSSQKQMALEAELLRELDEDQANHMAELFAQEAKEPKDEPMDPPKPEEAEPVDKEQRADAGGVHAQRISSQEASMRSCLHRVKELNPPMTAAMQHQANLQILPADLKAWMRAEEKVFQAREAAIAKADRAEEERLELLAFRPKSMAETDAFEEVPEPEMDSLVSEVPEAVQPKSSLSTDDFLMDVDWRQTSKLRSNVGSKLSFMSTLEEAPAPAPPSHCSSRSSPREVAVTNDRPAEPESPIAAISEETELSRPASAVRRPASAGALRARPGSGKRPARNRPGSAAGSTRPPSGTGTASTAPSRPSSAARLRDLFSSKLSRLARPSSALSRSSSSTRLSLDAAQGEVKGAASPTSGASAGNISSWFSNRTNLLTR